MKLWQLNALILVLLAATPFILQSLAPAPAHSRIVDDCRKTPHPAERRLCDEFSL